jgi:L-threonylcarbamoyladenylate synthase
VFPADTVYGLACSPDDADAVARMYALKGRAPDKPAATMLFSVDALPELPPRIAAAARALLPGAVTLLVPGGPDGAVLGLRVPDVPLLMGVRVPVLQTSANRAGGPDACRLQDVPEDIREGADLVIDGGQLPGTPSTVIDLTSYEDTGGWSIAREGAVPAARIATALA